MEESIENCDVCGRARTENPVCWCGYDHIRCAQTHITANEEFIYSHTRTSHKRYESMVVYALHYALRDLELRSQFHVRVNQDTYMIDLYSPDLKLAIEIDEPYHESAEQSDRDIARENAIRSALGCEFVRINCRSSIYDQVDRLVHEIKKRDYPFWEFKRPNLNLKSGEYSQAHWQKLMASDAIQSVELVKERLKSELQFEISEKPINGIPSLPNGEYGFVVSSTGRSEKLAVYARATGLFHVRLLETDDPVNDALIPAQISHKWNGPRFYKIKTLERGTNDTDLVIKTVVDWFG